ncbi:MAG: NAD-dependent epimerase/dehydratase family protein [Cyclobacteriaceae bacterium]|nr:NAD-dependent epimerase/dehydratase family protein [Cyclobacteriaceae bacterium]
MIAVTGANGLLGSFVLRALAAHAPVVGLHRAGSNLPSENLPNVTWRLADITDALALEEALQGVTTVIHTAAEVSFNPRKRKTMMRVNVEGTRNVVDACLALQIPRLIHVSSVAALGRKAGMNKITETSLWTENDLNTDYAESKHLAEREVWRGAEEGLAVNVINPSVILAPTPTPRSSARIFEYVARQRKFYTDTQVNYVDVRDVVRVIEKLLHQPTANRQYIVSAGHVPVKNLFELIARQLNCKAPSVRLTPRLARWVARAEMVRSWIRNSEPFITQQSIKLARHNFYYDSGKVQRELQIDFHTLEETIAWCCQQYLHPFSTNK